jgi:hypothetical protein
MLFTTKNRTIIGFWSEAVFVLQEFKLPRASCYFCGIEIYKLKASNWLTGWLKEILTDWLPNLTFILLMWRIVWAPNSILIYSYIQQDATLRSLFISGNCSTCFGWYFHPTSGAHTTVSIASGICHTVTAICRYRGRVGTGLSVLWVAYGTHSTLKPVPTLPR